jgi:four helix bundle protein
MENDFTRTVSFFRFEDLRVYHKAIDYVDWVANLTEMLPQKPNNDIVLKFNTIAQSIAFYIAEGSARNKSQFIHYLKLAKSSLRECIVLADILEKQGTLSSENTETSRNQIIELTKMIGALIGSLEKSNKKQYENKSGVPRNNERHEEEFEFIDQSDIRKY